MSQTAATNTPAVLTTPAPIAVPGTALFYHQKYKGVVNYWEEKEGYGYITPMDPVTGKAVEGEANEVFVHFSAIPKKNWHNVMGVFGDRSLVVGELVEFTLKVWRTEKQLKNYGLHVANLELALSREQHDAAVGAAHKAEESRTEEAAVKRPPEETGKPLFAVKFEDSKLTFDFNSMAFINLMKVGLQAMPVISNQLPELQEKLAKALDNYRPEVLQELAPELVPIMDTIIDNYLSRLMGERTPKKPAPQVAASAAPETPAQAAGSEAA